MNDVELNGVEVVEKIVQQNKKAVLEFQKNGNQTNLSSIANRMRQNMNPLRLKALRSCGLKEVVNAPITKICGEQLQNAKNGEPILSLAEVIKQEEKEEEDINTYGN